MNDSQHEIESLVHLYQDGAFSRRDLVRRMARYTGSAASAAALLHTMNLPCASAQECPADVRIPEGAPDLDTQMVEFRGVAGTVFGYLARPRDITPPRTRVQVTTATRPGVLVIHENRGLNDHIMDVTRRVARAGYIGLGVDLLSRLGGTNQFPDPQQAGAAYNRVGAAAFLEDMQAAVAHMKTISFVERGRLGAVGFCAGGGNCLSLAVTSPDVSCAVAFYPGTTPTAEQLDRLAGPVLGIFGELDRNVTLRVPALLTTLLDRRKVFGIHVYEGVSHAFHNDTGPSYNRTAACDAWAKTIAFFDRHLRQAG